MFHKLTSNYTEQAVLAKVEYLYIIYYVFAEISRSGHSRHAVTASESHSEPQSYRMSHEKAPDMTEKVSAEVKV